MKHTDYEREDMLATMDALRTRLAEAEAKIDHLQEELSGTRSGAHAVELSNDELRQENLALAADVGALTVALRDVVEGYRGWLPFCDDPDDGCAEVWAESIDAAEKLLSSPHPGAEELERLRKIEAALPKTADGVAVVPGVDRVWWPKADRNTDHWRNGAVVACYGCISSWTYDLDKFPDNDVERQITVAECYSTREAAEAAGKEGK